MARPRNTFPKFISINVRELRILAEQLGDKWAEWSIKALDDLILGCVRDDVDHVVLDAFNDAIGRMSKAQEDNHKKYEARKSSKNSSETAVATINQAKRNDQLIWGDFENVYLSQDEWNDLLKEYGNLELFKKVIDAFSSSLADGTCVSNNHYATLQRWIRRRKEWDAEKEQGKETFQEREGRRQVEQLKRFGVIR